MQHATFFGLSATLLVSAGLVLGAACSGENTACLDFLASYSKAPQWIHGTTSNAIGGCTGSGLGVSGPGSQCVAGVGNMAFCLLDCGQRTDNHFHRHWCGEGPSGYLWVR
ncbi:MAG: hypothetical protein HY744_10450 [Deltaproteobacteria bacterium]|nr:hypothetical protein [Deltaproteobacteria bacterium]